jgi:hypothetical protein
MQNNLSFYYVICHIWPQFWYFVWKTMWKLMQYKPIENYHLENAILGKTLTLMQLAPYFMFSPKLKKHDKMTTYMSLIL